MGVHTSVTARHTGTQHGNLIPQIYSLIPTIPKNPHPKYSQPHPLSQILRKSSHRFNRFNKKISKWHVTRFPRWLANLLLVDLLTRWLLKKNRWKNPQQPWSGRWGDDVAAPESVVGIRELWCGDSFMYLIPSTQSVNYGRGCVFLLRFRLIMA